MGDTLSPLIAWQSFYVIIGSSAAALTGLQFVVIALIAQGNRRSSTGETATFGTPTIVHLCAALLVAAITDAPWRTLAGPSLALGACGALGVVYVLIIANRARHTKYRPVLEDRLWHFVFPFIAYVALFVAAVLLDRDVTSVLFVVAAATLFLLFIGIHNAWDTATYLAIDLGKPGEK